MDALQIAKEIENLILESNKVRAVIKDRGEKAAVSLGEYRKALAVTIIKLNNGIEMELDGEKIINPKATYTQEIAHGINWKEKIECEKSQALYESAKLNLRQIEMQISALQSLFRRFDNL